MKFAYADPPYIGKAHFYPENTEVDHVKLVADLVAQYPDGWALSCSSPTLQQILAMCPSDVRVGAWVKPFCAFKANVTVAYAWEPIIFRGGRKRPRTMPTVRDWVSASITLKKGLVGAKPEGFAHWLCELFNVQPGDELVDLFPGTGIVGRIFADRTAVMPEPQECACGLVSRGLVDGVCADCRDRKKAS